MNVKETIEELLAYYTCTRQIGHTRAMLEGAKNTECTVIAHNQNSAIRLREQGVDAISVHELSALKGKRVPIVLDNATLHFLFAEVLRLKDGESKRKLRQVLEVLISDLK